LPVKRLLKSDPLLGRKNVFTGVTTRPFVLVKLRPLALTPACA
jgi:hypothetical protein